MPADSILQHVLSSGRLLVAYHPRDQINIPSTAPVEFFPYE